MVLYAIRGGQLFRFLVLDTSSGAVVDFLCLTDTLQFDLQSFRPQFLLLRSLNLVYDFLSFYLHCFDYGRSVVSGPAELRKLFLMAQMIVCFRIYIFISFFPLAFSIWNLAYMCQMISLSLSL